MFKIEENIAIESYSPNQQEKGELRKTLHSMGSGDSFLYPLNGRSLGSQRIKIHAAAMAEKVKIVTRKTLEGDLRVWRVK